MSLNKFSIIALVLISLVGCSKKAPESSTVTIRFDEEVFSSGPQSSLSLKSNPVNFNGPDWGLSDPQFIADIGCFAVFVGGPEDFMQNQSCTLSNGNAIRFGARVGLFKKGDVAEIELPPGKRRFFIAGMASQNGSCEDIQFDPELDDANYSAPFLLGQTLATLDKAEVEVRIPVSDVFSTSNKIDDCDFIKDDGNNGGGMQIVPYPSKRRIWVAENEIPRTVTVNHSGDDIMCSLNGGAMQACNPSGEPDKLIWAQSNYVSQDEFTIYSMSGDSVIESETFRPFDEYEALDFVTCTDTILTSENNWSNLGAAITGPGVYCFADGYSLNAAGARVTLPDGISLISPQGSSATIKNTSASEPIFEFNSAADGVSIGFVGLKMESAVGAAAAIDIASSASTGTVDVYFDSSILKVTSTTGDGIQVVNLGTGNLNLFMNRSFVKNQVGTLSAVHVGTANLVMDFVQLESQMTALYAIEANLDINDSHLVTQGSTGYPIHLYDSIADVDSSLLLDGSGAGTIIESNSSSTSLNIDSSVIARDNSHGSAGQKAFSLINSAMAWVDSDRNDNYFCRVGTAQYDGLFNTANTLGNYEVADMQGAFTELCDSNLPGPLFNATELSF